MCSILGIIDFKNAIQDKSAIAKKLNHSMSHRGPDDEGYYNDNKISLAFNRLSILDLANGNQPIKLNNIISIFNGEIYNYKDIKNQLIAKGYKFSTTCDSEIIPSAYKEWGESFVKKLDGMFAISLYDKEKNKIFLYRDRSGIKPLYFNFNSDYFIFSSELKGIINFPHFKKQINQEAIFSYLCFRYPINDKQNFLKGIQRVSPGNFLVIDLEKQSFENKIFWEIPNFSVSKVPKKEEDIIDELDNKLNYAVKSQMISDVPVGVFLSGGLDSSLLTSIMTKYSAQQINSFSVNFKEEDYDESHYSNLISNKCNTKHHNILISQKEFLENLENVIKIKDAPLSIPHEYALFALSKKMNGIVKVVLSGEGADEHFGGYSRVQSSPFDFSKGMFIQKNFNFNIIKKIFKLNQKLDYSENNFLHFFLDRYKWFSIDEATQICSKNFMSNFNLNDVLKNWTENFSERSKSNFNFYDLVLYYFQKNHLPCLLDRLDTMTMANSIEARVPFLNHNLIQFINNLPFDFKIRWMSNHHKFFSLFSNSEKFAEKMNINKYLLRKTSEKYLPKEVSHRKKLGFPLPMDKWMENDYVKDTILESNSFLSGIFKKKQLEQLIDYKIGKKSIYDFTGKKIWMVLNLQLWAKNFL
tara:strand:- start:10495 stop:12414 length:1920 start_codon:yes stop_codon:yes gene_type:complete